MNINEFHVVNPVSYENFIKKNSGKGNLKVHAYAASEALPVSGLRIIVSTSIEGEKVIFFDGKTDASGMIESLSLPAPSIAFNNLEVPNSTLYTIEAISEKEEQNYSVNMYDGICVVQNINFIPGGMYGS